MIVAGSLTVDGLVDAVDLGLAIGDGADTGAGKETQAAGDDAGLVGDDVAKEVAGDDDAVEGLGVLDHQHGGRVDEMVAKLELRELLLHDLSKDLPPQTAGRQDVGLVKTPDGRRRVLLQRQVGG